ncbi:MAG: hypothetical protein AAGF06_04270 [Pseudomonadota bacterium]
MTGIRWFVCLILLALSHSAYTVSPEINIQQRQFEFERENWNKVRLPKGLASVPRKSHDLRHSGYSGVSMYAQNMLLNYTGGIEFDIASLSALLEPTQAGRPVELNDIRTFSIDIVSGNLTLPEKTLEFLFNRHVLNYKERSLRNVSIQTDADGIYIDAEVRLNKPFPRQWLRAQMAGHVSLDQQQRISIDIKQMKMLNMPLGKPMQMLDLSLDRFVTLDRPGVKLKGRQIKIDLGVLPPPRLNGRLSRAVSTANGINIQFSSPQGIIFDTPPISSNSYMWLQSGDLRLSNMIILNGHLQALNVNPHERLKFHLYSAIDQIAGGHVRINAASDVIAYLPSVIP